MTPTLTILAILATFRTAYLVVYEDGPWDAAVRLRSFFINRYGATSWQGKGIQCMLCVSFWVALVWGAVALWGGIPGLFLLLWWGAAGGVLALQSWLLRGRG